jgi:hydrogenase maturation protein HypF
MTTASPRARRYVVTGVVQGVGFRPHVWRLATGHHLGGFVRNHDGVVEIHVEGHPDDLARFDGALSGHAPPRARIDHIELLPAIPSQRAGFTVAPSTARADDRSDHPNPVARAVAPDSVTCPACLAEVHDPTDRRHRHPFASCTDCGPRATIITAVPYDRRHTSMSPFPMCADCVAEYDDPVDRRFHAEALACPSCGPRLALVDGDGNPLAGDPIEEAAALVRAGGIVAVKGLGGYQLACDATDTAAVAELRRRKRRPDKPLAVLVGDLDAARAIAAVDPVAADALSCPVGPIVIVARRSVATPVEEVTPGLDRIGVMLPATALHHLLVAAVDRPLVLTSGNRSGEPIAITDADARRRLADVADGFLVHDRRIVARADDSVMALRHGATVVVRRARGLAPEAVALPVTVGPTLALGAQWNVAPALASGAQAFLVPHVGDLDTDDARDALVASLDHHRSVLGIEPTVVAHDLHPDLLTTRLASTFDARSVAVQHHHAHVVAVMAEHGRRDPVVGVAFDGFGFGDDSGAWGGEWLVCDWSGYERAGSLRAVSPPGGDAAVRHPARMALAHGLDAGRADETAAALGLDGDEPSPLLAGARPSQLTAQVLAGLASPPTTSVGRLFDAVAALAGLCHRPTFDGHAAVLVEHAADRADPAIGRLVHYPVALDDVDGRLVVDTRPLIAAVLDDLSAAVPAAVVAWRFHRWLAVVTVEVTVQLSARCGFDTVALAGGVFVNDRLHGEVTRGLRAAGLAVLSAQVVPSGDGGLALGQVLVAHASGAR